MQRSVTLLIKEDIVIHLPRIIRRVLTQELENCSSIIGPVDKVGDGDLARVGQGRTEVRKFLGGDPCIKPRAIGLKVCRSIN
jgi:hypothetical protein